MIDIAHLERKRTDVICAFAKVRKCIDKLSKLRQDPERAEALTINIFDEFWYLERRFRSMIEFLINLERKEKEEQERRK